MHSARPFRACVLFFLLLFALPAVGQEKISGPWVWLAVSGDGYVSYDHLGIDWLEKRTGLKEEDLVLNGITAGTKAGNYVWREGFLSGSADNLHELVRAAGVIGAKTVWSWYWYAFAVVESEMDQPSVIMRTGSDDGIKVWLNGKQVHAFNGFRTAPDFLNQYPVNLKKGRNLLVVKIFQGTNTWGFHGGIQAHFKLGEKTYKPGPEPVIPLQLDAAYAALIESETLAQMRMAYEALDANRFQDALNCLGNADASAARNVDFAQGAYRAWGSERLAALAKLRLSGVVNRKVLQVRGIWTLHTDVHQEVRGVRYDITNSITEAEIRGGLQAQTYLKYWFEAASGGNYSLHFENSFLDSTVEAVEYFGPVITLVPGKVAGLGALLSEKALDTDAFVMYWPSKGLSGGMGVGGAWTPTIDAAGNSLGALRGIIQMSSTEASWNTAGLLKHEFMHVIEILIHDGFAHTFGEERRAAFPDWTGSLSDQDSFYYWYIANKLKLPWSELDYTDRYPDRQALAKKYAGNARPLVDAGFNAGDGSLYIFQGGSYVRYDIATDKVLDGYPRKIASDWNLPWAGAPDASFTALDAAKVWMIKGSSVVLLDIATRKMVPGYPKTVSEQWPGIWPQGIDSAIAWGDGYLYFFKGQEYLTWDLSAGRLYSPDAQRIADGWKGVSFGRLDEVLNIGGKFYFFSINDYIRYDRGGGKALSGYPLPVVSYWRGILPYGD